MDNDKIIKMFDTFADNSGIPVLKSEAGVVQIDNANFGGILPRPLVENLISLSRNQSQWLSNITTSTKSRQKGYVPITDFSQPTMEFVNENDPKKVTNVPDTRNVAYNCEKAKSEFYITTDQLREASEAGIEEFEATVTRNWAEQLGNDIANLVINGDKGLGSQTRSLRALNKVDGLRIQSAGANVNDAAGKGFGPGIFGAMRDLMPDKYAEDPGLMWMYSRSIENQWVNSLSNVNAVNPNRNTGSGDQALVTNSRIHPLGIPQLLVPQIRSNYGPAGSAPTTVATSSGNLNVRVTTILADATDSTGRRVRVTYLPSGQTSTGTVYRNGGQNFVDTVGILGQTTASTTAADYLVEVADQTDLFLLNPKGINLIYCTEWRTYREFNKDFDRFEITTYLYVDVLVPIPETMVKFENVSVPKILDWTAAA